MGARVPSLLLSGVLVIMVAGFTGCTRFSTPADLTFVNGAEPETLDPGIITGQPEGRIANALFEGLLTRNAAGELIPGVAEDFPEVSEDGLTYRFRLRPDARWSNGDRVTAHDFEYSWKRVLDPLLASQYAEQLYYIENGQAYNEGRIKDPGAVGIRALDDRTLEVRLANPSPFFSELVAFTTYLPVHRPTVEKYGGNFVKPGNLVSNGAYMLESWYMNDRIRLRRNPHYWRPGSPKSEVLDIVPTDQAGTAFNLFYTGAADLVADKGLVPAQIIDSIRDKPWFHVSPILATYFYRFNVTRPPFDNPKVRQALALAVDKERIVRKITRTGEPVALTFTPPGIANGAYEPPPGWPYDPARARQLLAEAGYPDGQGFRRFSILFNISELNKEIAIEIQEMWKTNLNLEVDLRNQEWKVYLNTLTTLDYDVARSSWVGDYNDPNTFLDCFVTGRGNNRTGWSNPAYDALIEAANRERQPARRMQIFQEAEEILIQQDFPIFPIYYFVAPSLYHPDRLAGFQPNLLDEHPLREVYRIPKEQAP